MPTISFPQKERTSQQTGRTTDAYLIVLERDLVSALSNGSALRRLGQVENGKGGSMLNNLSGPSKGRSGGSTEEETRCTLTTLSLLTPTACARFAMATDTLLTVIWTSCAFAAASMLLRLAGRTCQRFVTL
jgi:hypothetical protein